MDLKPKDPFKVHYYLFVSQMRTISGLGDMFKGNGLDIKQQLNYDFYVLWFILLYIYI